MDATGIIETAGSEITPCDAWAARYELRLKDAKRWATAAYLVGITAAIALVAAIILAVVGENGAAIASGVGTILTGAATTWLWSRRTEVQKEAVDFLDKVKQFCGEAKLHQYGLA